ncbi:MAG: 2-hydroxychromene-2-carboxylate isomerase [Ferrovibrio sp.]|uniref:2-hydroxychromene-2-carboxylate isomerase n=1 Tax=Ferrovibrio sp. TaxID=1917215 RepID=UPI0026215EF4|nr:2-hydroxychromene-2-carboxylate isomerase [Ferrovibrio sp.]MCW0233673.1 2-hydroxychromene-2-carboxylate isomerase [Ferrovibrio sp.]
MAAQIDYYTFISSPWAYLGSRRFAAMAAKYGARVKITPMAPLMVFEATGGLPLGKRSQQRQDYRFVELERWRSHLGVKLNLRPAGFPVNETLAGKLVVAARDDGGNDAAIALAHAMMQALWAEERNIADPENLEEILNEAGLDPARLFAAADSDTVQAEYERGTRQAIAAGAFGAPFYVVDGEPFWGQDRLDFVERKLAAAK